MDPIELPAVRGMAGVKEATLHVGGMDVNICVASGMANAAPILDQKQAENNKSHCTAAGIHDVITPQCADGHFAVTCENSR